MRVVWLSNGMGSRVTSELVDHFFFVLQTLCGLPRQLTPFDELSR